MECGFEGWEKFIVYFNVTLIGASFWGIGGTASDYLFEKADININWFVSTRLVISGLLLLGAQMLLTGKRAVFTIWKDS